MKAPSDKPIILFDADNTLWDWVKYYAPAYEAMAETIAKESKKRPEEVQKAMQEYYRKKGTIEDSGLVQGLTENHFFEHLSAAQINRLTIKAHNAFKAAQPKKLPLYDGIEEALKEIASRNIFTAILTDATQRKALNRLKQSNLDQYFKYVISLPTQDPKQMPEELEKERQEEKKHWVQLELIEIKEQKPDTPLEKILGLTREQISKNVIIVGDNEKKDIALAQKFDCVSLHAEYGHPNPADLSIITKYSPHSVLMKNMRIECGIKDTEPKKGSTHKIISVRNPGDIASIIQTITK